MPVNIARDRTCADMAESSDSPLLHNLLGRYNTHTSSPPQHVHHLCHPPPQRTRSAPHGTSSPAPAAGARARCFQHPAATPSAARRPPPWLPLLQFQRYQPALLQFGCRLPHTPAPTPGIPGGRLPCGRNGDTVHLDPPQRLAPAPLPCCHQYARHSTAPRLNPATAPQP